MKDLKDLVRPNVWNLKPYSSARDEFHGDASVFLDANENPWNMPYNRYPDPLQWKLKDRLAVLKGVDRSSISGNSLDRGSIYKILKNYEGIVVIDEAYIDFSAYPSFLKELSGFPNLIVLQTLSKAWGAAGIRLGMAFASPEIIGVLNKIKYPYNVNQLTQEKALELLNDEATMKHQVNEILTERNRLEKILSEPPFSYQVYPSDANFLLVNVAKADAMYNGLVKKGIVVRNRSNVQKCRGCLRITIGTPKENDSLLNAMKNMKL